MGYRLVAARRAPPPAARGRLLHRPVFILCPVRSGSTLLRMMLDSHSALCAPHELHLMELSVQVAGTQAQAAIAELGLSGRELEHWLWDGMLHRVLAASGKQTLVEKTPNHVFMWRRIVACWPDARFIFLLRDPAAVCASWHRVRSHWSDAEAIESTRKYVTALEQARRHLTGHTVRYEDLTADPERELRGVCAYLGVPWEPAMLEYGAARRVLAPGLGDWKAKIRTGTVQPGRPAPADVPESLRATAAAWGYLDGYHRTGVQSPG